MSSDDGEILIGEQWTETGQRDNAELAGGQPLHQSNKEQRIVPPRKTNEISQIFPIQLVEFS